MRLKKSMYTGISGLILMLCTGIFSFIKISLIVNTLGNEINGLNNLNSQIFNFLMIGEAGLGLATTTLLYKPISNGDTEEANKILAGSQFAIIFVIAGILGFSAIISIFVPNMILNSNLSKSFIIITFLLFSIKALIPQITQPIKAYVMANQEEYYLNIFKIGTVLFVSIIEIFLIVTTQNYKKILVGGLIATFISEVITFIILKRKYKFINLLNKEKDFRTVKHMKELVKVNIVGTVAKSVDPVIISKCLGLIITSLYSNYAYVQNFIQSIAGIVLGSVTHMFGDMFTRKEKDVYKKFTLYIIITNIIATVIAVCFYYLIQIFIPIWVGEKSLLNIEIALLFSFLIYMYTMMRPINTLVVTNGYFKLSSKSAIYETLINLVLSVVLIRWLGISGVLIASIISYLVASFWYFPINTYKKVFGLSSKLYFKLQFKCFTILISSYILMGIILTINPIQVVGILDFIRVSIVNFTIILSYNLIIYLVAFKSFRKLIYKLYLKFKEKKVNS